MNVVSVLTAAQMHRAVLDHAAEADVVIMAAAVSDFKPVSASDRKIKKETASTVIELERTPDILKSLGALNGGRLLVGFAAETDDVRQNALQKLKDKNLDLIVANDLLKQGAGFGADTNSVTMIDRFGRQSELPVMPKGRIAAQIIDKIVELRNK